MKTLKFLFAVVFLFALTSCGHYADGSSVWQKGLWIIPVLTTLGAGFFVYRAYVSSKSGSNINPIYGGGEGGNVPIYKHGFFWFSVALVIATIVIIIMVNSDK